VTNQTTENASQTIIPGYTDTDSLSEPYRLAPYWKQIQEKLFPIVQEQAALESQELTDKLKTLVQVLEIVRIEELVAPPKAGKRGGQQIDRRPIARAFLAKAFFNLSQTRALKELLHQSEALRKICGMEKVPSEPTFSRAFTLFAQQDLGTKAHLTLVKRLVSPQIVMHVSHDSTAVEAREKALKKVKAPKVKKNEGDPGREKRDLPQSRHESRGR
jgi:transposase